MERQFCLKFAGEICKIPTLSDCDVCAIRRGYAKRRFREIRELIDDSFAIFDWDRIEELYLEVKAPLIEFRGIPGGNL